MLTQIMKWAKGDGERRMYWLKGMAGTGKSTIALTIACECYNDRRLGASFFFSRGGGDLALVQKFVATIAS
jgi:replicative DNA helicase